MTKQIFITTLVFVAAFMLHQASFASEVISLPPEELAKESVLPVFKKHTTVKNRNVTTDKRLEAQIFYGYNMTEPIFNVSKVGVGAYYNMTEDHAVGVLYTHNMTGLADYANQIKKDTPAIAPRIDGAYKPQSNLLVDYNFKAFYGKLSVSKNTVLNSILLFSGGVGYAQYENSGYPLVSGGLGQKFYFTNNLALRFDMRLLMHQAPSPVTAGYKERMTFFTVLDVGLSYLF
ncbi:MAG: outer membrane beta-barrel domain-containing protein [Bdellovibrionia bacterium]